MTHFQYAVIGAGLAGSATAWQLAERGHTVALLERTSPANAWGSSHGSARIIRYAYPDDFYAGLVVLARQQWSELERQSGVPLITSTGALDFGIERDPELLARVLDSVGVENHRFTADEAMSRWPMLRFDTPVLWHPGAGVIDAESAVKAMVALATEQGAHLLNDWPVARVERMPAGYRIHSSAGEVVTADNVVVSAGGWLPDLLGELPLPDSFVERMPRIEVRQENAFHFPYREAPGAGASGAGALGGGAQGGGAQGGGAPAGGAVGGGAQGGSAPSGGALGGAGRGDADDSPSWPTFIYKTPGLEVYGLPGGRDAGFNGQKVAEYDGGRRMRSASEQDGMIDPANRERVIDFVSRFVPGLVPEPYAETTCLFTNTPTQDFILDRVDGITILSPCSGHGAKFAPLMGAFAADLATGRAPVQERFAVARG